MRPKSSTKAGLLPLEANAAHLEALLDAALADSFPASDPIAVWIDDGTAPYTEAGEERG